MFLPARFQMAPRLFLIVYGLINICKCSQEEVVNGFCRQSIIQFPCNLNQYLGKEPWQAGLNKFLEAYESGWSTGDIEYAVSNLYQYANSASFGCGENLKKLSRKIQ